MHGSKRRLALVVLAAAAAAFVVSGGLATARRMIIGRDLAPGTITSRELANGSVTARQLARGLQRSLRGSRGSEGRRGEPGTTGAAGAAGATGAAGAGGAKGETGAAGPTGPQGATGAPGAYSVVDAAGRTVGSFAGWFNGSFSTPYYSVMTPEGAILFYDGGASSNAPSNASPSVLFYKTTGCTGTPYVNAYAPSQFGILTESPAGPGSAVYVLDATASPETFTYASYRNAGPCSNSSSQATQVFPARRAGSVPIVLKPLRLVPAG